MSGHLVPRSGGRPDKALRVLYAHGGRADLHTWMRLTEFTGAIYVFERDISGGLVRFGMVRMEGADFVVTAAGLDYLGIPLSASPIAPPQAAGPRVTPVARPLSAANMARVLLARDGAFAYADIPSRIGDQRLPHVPTIPGPIGGR